MGRSRGSLFLAAALVATLASVNFLVGLAEPHGTVWDETYYLTSTERYREHVAQFASHPPLGLMLIAAGSAVLDPNATLDTRSFAREKSVNGRQIPAGFSFTGVRVASGVFSVVGALAFFALLCALGGATVEALVFSNLFVFENAFIAQFRAAQLDAFQIAFATLALLCFVISARRRQYSSPMIEAAFGAACGLAMMVKVNAIVLLPLGGMLIARRLLLGWGTEPRGRLVLTAVRDAASQLAGCALVVVAVFVLHVTVSSHDIDPTSVAGQKDDRFLSVQYAEYLQGHRPLSAGVIASAARDYRRFMTADFEGVALSDPNGSDVFQWPLGSKTINYRWDSVEGRTAYVQLVGNKVSWILALAAPFAALVLLALDWWQPVDPRRSSTRRDIMGMLLLAYLGFVVLHAVLGMYRVMYLYHYFIGLILAFTLIPLVFEEALERWHRLQRWRSPLLGVFTGLLLASFVFYSPLTFHRPLTHAQCEWRNVFQRVVNCRL